MKETVYHLWSKAVSCHPPVSIYDDFFCCENFLMSLFVFADFFCQAHLSAVVEMEHGLTILNACLFCS